MKLLKTTILSIVILVPLAWGFFIVSVGSLYETIGSILLDTYFLPIILGFVALFFIIKGGKEASEQKKYSNSISIGILFVLIAIGVLLFIYQNAWS